MWCRSPRIAKPFSDGRMTKPASMNVQAIVYVKLIDEAVLVWRPVQARKIDPTTYLILEQPIPADEVWEFQPGTIVTVTRRNDGYLVAVENSFLASEQTLR